MKKIIYMALLLTSFAATAATTPAVNEKVLKAFKQTFTTAQNVTWEEFENTNYQANFKQNEIIVKAMFDSEGNLLETLRYYGEKELPANIKAKLNKKYSGKEIFGVTEAVSDSDVSYYVTLKDEKTWLVIKSDPYANFQQVDKFKNAGTPTN
jgi:hypothetical protein